MEQIKLKDRKGFVRVAVEEVCVCVCINVLLSCECNALKQDQTKNERT